MSYSEKLRDPRWQKKRLVILERDGWKCASCDDSVHTLHVHHRYYTRGKEPWEYEDSALVTLCETCHQEETEGLAQEIDALVSTLKLGGAMSAEINGLMSAFGGARNSPLSRDEWSELAQQIKTAVAQIFAQRRR